MVIYGNVYVFCHFTQKSFLIIFNVYLIDSVPPLFYFRRKIRVGDIWWLVVKVMQNTEYLCSADKNRH